MLWAAAVTHSFKLILAINFHVANYHGQHLLMDVNSRYPVRHRFPLGGSGERAANSLTRVTGYRRSTEGNRQRPIICSTTHAPDQTRGQPQLLQCELDLAASSLVLFCLRPREIFMRFSGPQAQTDTRESPDIPMVCSQTPT